MCFFFISFKKVLNYRSSVIFSILGSIISIYIQIALWRFVFRYDYEKTSYMVTYVILSNIINLFYSDGMCNIISEKIQKGTFATDLIRPINILKMYYFEVLGENCAFFLLRGIPIITIFFPIICRYINLSENLRIVYAIIAIICGHALYTILFSIIGLLSFTFIEIWSFSRIVKDTIRFLSGSFIPLAMYPKWLRKLSDVLPFKYLYSFPIEILIGKTNLITIVTNFINVFIWLSILIIILFVIYKKTINNVVIHGG